MIFKTRCNHNVLALSLGQKKQEIVNNKKLILVQKLKVWARK